MVWMLLHIHIHNSHKSIHTHTHSLDTKIIMCIQFINTALYTAAQACPECIQFSLNNNTRIWRLCAYTVRWCCGYVDIINWNENEWNGGATWLQSVVIKLPTPIDITHYTILTLIDYGETFICIYRAILLIIILRIIFEIETQLLMQALNAANFSKFNQILAFSYQNSFISQFSNRLEMCNWMDQNIRLTIFIGYKCNFVQIIG